MRAKSKIVARVAAYAFGVLLLPHAAWPQCNAKADPPYISVVGPPGERVCCSLGINVGIEPTALKGHQYGNQATLMPQTASDFGGEPDGYVYTAAAGLVDIGHVRDNADATLFAYIQLLDKQRRVYVGGDTAAVAAIPPAQMLAVAGAIVYVNSWSHELTTWGATYYYNILTRNDWSAFSPEDMSSNIVGIEAATRAINAGGFTLAKAFDAQMDIALAQIMKELGAQPAAETNRLLVAVKFVPPSQDLTAKWWMDDVLSPGNSAVRTLRRNFDGSVWRIPTAATAATPGWLNPTPRFTSYYPQFLYFVSDKRDVDATQVPRTNERATGGFAALQWVATDLQTLASDGAEVTGPAGVIGPCLADPKTHNVITSGQYTQVKVNVEGAGSLDVIWTFAHATQFIHNAFVKQNPNMDDPVKYAPPDAAPAAGPTQK